VIETVDDKDGIETSESPGKSSLSAHKEDCNRSLGNTITERNLSKRSITVIVLMRES
jgi:hypothetical protein